MIFFTRPVINGKIEEKTCGDGPSLMNMFDDDAYLRDIIQKIKQSIDEGFETAKKYATTFEKYQRFYVENESLDLQAVREEEHGKQFLNSLWFVYLKKYVCIQALK